MADNIVLNSGSGGATLAADDVAGVHIQRVKLVEGADGANDGDISSANPLPVNDATLETDVEATNTRLGEVSATPTANTVLARLKDLLTELQGKADLAETQPVSAASLPLPTGAATETTLGAVKTAVELIDNAISGAEMQVDVVAPLPAGSNNIGDVDIASLPNEGQQTKANSISVAIASDQDPVETRYQTPATAGLTQAAINASGSGDNTLVSATAGQTIRAFKLFLVCSSDVDIKFVDGVAGTDLTPAMKMFAGGGITLDLDGEPWFVTTSGNALVLNLSAAVQVSGRIYYEKS